ncbi:protein singed-like [Uloborus diversus]|uniref:protein singed-like n=1 Tax=Uloborus diversus TaxID=327109 RepID=UPI00240A15EC|nr:protein singed-like [Uloborus diversus]
MSMTNGTSAEGSNGLTWHVGLLNTRYKYLTAETFGCKVNANGVALKKKQLWCLEPFLGGDADEEAVCLKSHLGKYLAVDQFGNVTCDSEERDTGAKFKVVVHEDGRWALKNVARGYFLGASDDKLLCSAKAPGDSELWTVHLAARPQVNLRSIGRRRYARLSTEQDEIQVDANTPWGEDALFTLEFRDGRYAVHACNGKFLRSDGKLSDACDCLFGLEFHGGHLALRDPQGRYVSPIGSKAVLRTRSQTVTKDELFALEDSVPQSAFAGFNGKYVSVKQGVDVTANQDEISDHETFQLEFNEKTKSWHIRTMQDKYWSLDSSGGIQANASKGPSSAHFVLEWMPEGSVLFKANNGKYVAAKKSGHLYANSDKVEDMEKFYFYLINRQTLVLKCEQGFVGYKSAASPKLECNKATYESIFIERGEKGICYFKGNNGKYWHANSDGTISVDSDVSQGFYIELREPSKLCIKTTDGNYIVAEKNGLFKVGGSASESATTWEY